MLVLSESDINKLAQNYITYGAGKYTGGHISACWLFEFVQDIIRANERMCDMVTYSADQCDFTNSIERTEDEARILAAIAEHKYFKEIVD